jgi:hypothetical protein
MRPIGFRSAVSFTRPALASISLPLGVRPNTFETIESVAPETFETPVAQTRVTASFLCPAQSLVRAGTFAL